MATRRSLRATRGRGKHSERKAHESTPKSRLHSEKPMAGGDAGSLSPLPPPACAAEPRPPHSGRRDFPAHPHRRRLLPLPGAHPSAGACTCSSARTNTALSLTRRPARGEEELRTREQLRMVCVNEPCHAMPPHISSVVVPEFKARVRRSYVFFAGSRNSRAEAGRISKLSMFKGVHRLGTR